MSDFYLWVLDAETGSVCRFDATEQMVLDSDEVEEFLCVKGFSLSNTEWMVSGQKDPILGCRDVEDS